MNPEQKKKQVANSQGHKDIHHKEIDNCYRDVRDKRGVLSKQKNIIIWPNSENRAQSGPRVINNISPSICLCLVIVKSEQKNRTEKEVRRRPYGAETTPIKEILCTEGKV